MKTLASAIRTAVNGRESNVVELIVMLLTIIVVCLAASGVLGSDDPVRATPIVLIICGP